MRGHVSFFALTQTLHTTQHFPVCSEVAIVCDKLFGVCHCVVWLYFILCEVGVFSLLCLFCS